MLYTEIKNQLDVASDHIQNGNLESAEQIYISLLNINNIEINKLFNFITEYLNGNDELIYIQTLTLLIKVTSKEFYFYQALANYLLGKNKAGEALKLYSEFEKINPTNANVHFNRALVLKNNYDYNGAIQSYQTAINLDISAPQEVYSNMALVYSEMNKAEKAEAALKKSLELHPKYIPAKYNLAGLYEERGMRDEALTLYADILKQDPNYFQALVRAAYAINVENSNHDLVKRLKRGLRRNSINTQTKVELLFALGKVLDDCGEYEKAFSYYQQANQICMNNNGYDLKKQEDLTGEILSFFTPEMLENTQLNSEYMPIIICGMFRSGSSLLEQVLGGHNQITTAGEMPFFPEIANLELINYPTSLAETEQTDLVMWAKKYIDICSIFSEEGELVTNKRPDNFLYVGLIKVLFPNAKIIFTERNENDNALSIYSQHLSNHYSYANSFADIKHYFSQYKKIVSHWKIIFNDDIHVVNYESLVSNLEQTARGVIEFCGLPWDNQCLDFQNRTKQVKTASIWQVRQPLHNKSIGRWNNYEKYIEPINVVSTNSSLDLAEEKNKTPLSWDRYWKENSDNASYQMDSLQEVVLINHWETVFNSTLFQIKDLEMLDIACGNGAVTKMAIKLNETQESKSNSYYCTDFSKAALATILTDNPCVKVIPADARQLPFMNDIFDLVVSQFGLEYVGLNGFKESIRVLKKEGIFAGVFHLKNGAIYDECKTVYAALDNFQITNFIKSAENLFVTAFEIKNGNLGSDNFSLVDVKLSASVEKVKKLFSEIGTDIANGVLFAIYSDIANMYSKIESYDVGDIITWFEKVNFELSAYKERMLSMLNSSMNAEEFGSLKCYLSSLGVVEASSGKLKNITKKHYIGWYYTGIKAK